MADLSNEVVQLSLEASPSSAIELGTIPPRHWEPATSRQRADLAGRARHLASTISGDDQLAVASRFHLESAASLIELPVTHSLNHMTGPVAAVGWAADAWVLGLDPDCSAYLEMLHTMRGFTDDLMRTATDDPGVNSKDVLDAFRAQATTLLAAHEGNTGPLFKPFRDAQEHGNSVSEPIVRDAVGVGLDCIRELANFAAQLAKSAVAASPLPNMPSLYETAILRGTSVAMTPDEIQELGYSILHDTEAETNRLLETVDADELIPPDKVLASFEATYALLDSRLSLITDVRPKSPCIVRAMPDEQASVGPPAFYGPASHENARPGIIYANCKSPMKTWEQLPLVMHESVPGHHLQTAVVDEATHLSPVLRKLYPKAIVEGWGVYAESLSNALQLDISPTERFGLLSCKRWRAARLVVDAGLHAQGWSVDRATDFIVEATRQDRANARREVVRYLAWPGQALSYTVGAEKIRGWVEHRVAGGTTIRDAHTELLNAGYVTLDYLQR